MKTPVDERLREEAERFQLRFRCDDCVHFDGKNCVHGYPTEPHRRSLTKDSFVVFCKELEIG
jgi:hypothetical protein